MSGDPSNPGASRCCPCCAGPSVPGTVTARTWTRSECGAVWRTREASADLAVTELAALERAGDVEKLPNMALLLRALTIDSNDDVILSALEAVRVDLQILWSASTAIPAESVDLADGVHLAARRLEAVIELYRRLRAEGEVPRG